MPIYIGRNELNSIINNFSKGLSIVLKMFWLITLTT